MKKKVFAVLLIFALLISAMSVVSSASSLTVTANSSPEAVKPGEEVTITVSLTNIDKGDKDGVNGVTGKISYNSSILTYVGNTALNGWTVNGFENLTFAITNGNQYITSNQEVISFTFKVNDNVSVSSTNVLITEIETSFGTEADVTNAKTVGTLDATAIVNIDTSSEVSPAVDPTPAQIPEQTTDQSTVTPRVTSNVINSNSSSDKTLPQTGVEDVILPAILVLGVISIISYIRYKNYKNI